MGGPYQSSWQAWAAAIDHVSRPWAEWREFNWKWAQKPKEDLMVDGSLGEVLRGAEVVDTLARRGRAASLTASAADVDEIDAARGREYALLSVLLARAPDQSLLDRLADLAGDSTPLGVAHAA